MRLKLKSQPPSMMYTDLLWNTMDVCIREIEMSFSLIEHVGSRPIVYTLGLWVYKSAVKNGMMYLNLLIPLGVNWINVIV